jgi:hypothetical protein
VQAIATNRARKDATGHEKDDVKGSETATAKNMLHLHQLGKVQLSGANLASTEEWICSQGLCGATRTLSTSFALEAIALRKVVFVFDILGGLA